MSFPRSFEEFVGNTDTVVSLRAAIAAGRLPHSLILSGARGSGKYTLALLLTLALECERQPRSLSQESQAAEGQAPNQQGPDGRPLAGFCGECRNCTRVLAAADLEMRVSEAVDAREEMRDTDKRETRILVQTHPDVLIVPPDPPQLLIKLGQIRTLIARAQRQPSEAAARVFIITSAAFMKEAANSLLKLLEEPPAYVHLMLLAENTSELLPTIRSRCGVVHLGALPAVEIADLLAARGLGTSDHGRDLLARLAEGAVGRALGFDLPAYMTARTDALALLRSGGATGNDHTSLFKMTETYRAGTDGQRRTDALLSAAAAVLEDMLLITAGLPERIRNSDIAVELERLAQVYDLASIGTAVRGLDAVRSGMRRNLLRSLALDSLAAELEATHAD